MEMSQKTNYMNTKFDYLMIGKVTGPFGNEGVMKVLPLTDKISRFNDLSFVFFKTDEDYVKTELENVRYNKNIVLIKLKVCTTRNEVEKFRDEYMYIDRKNAMEIDDSSFYYYDINGCVVKTSDGDNIGVISDIQNAGSCDVYVIRGKDNNKNEIYIPAVKDVIKKIDIDHKEIIIDVIEGLF